MTTHTPMTPGTVKTAMRAAGASANELWMIDPARIVVRKGYNVRTDNAAHRERIRWLADQMKAHGFNRKFALGVTVGKVGTVDTVFLDAGHRRLEAALLAISEGAQFTQVPAIPSAKGTTEEMLDEELLTSNDGDPLGPYERAKLMQRMSTRWGRDSEYIRQRFGFASRQHVDDMLMLMASPVGIRSQVEAEAISMTYAIAMIKKHGDKALEAIAAAVASSAKGRATPGKGAGNPYVKVAPQMHMLLEATRQDPAYSMLDSDLRVMLDELLGGAP